MLNKRIQDTFQLGRPVRNCVCVCVDVLEEGVVEQRAAALLYVSGLYAETDSTGA